MTTLNSPVHKSRDSTGAAERGLESVFVWTGGALFVASLAFCAYCYLIVWGSPFPDAIVGDRVASASRRGMAFLINASMFGAFAAHHSILARARVKARLERFVPERLQRSVYVWTASVLFIVVCALWQPIGGLMYDGRGPRAAAHALVQLAGLAVMAASVRVIDPLELAGIRCTAIGDELQTTGPYGWVRHPVYLGWILMVFGAAHMTADRLAFAAISSAYLILAIPWEERSLRRLTGARYDRYARRVPWRVIPYVY